jgi:hypothetical protein
LLPHPSQQRSIFAAPAYADPDTDFANQLHSYGIYGPRDTNAWFGTITCQRLNNHLDTDAYKSADFLAKNLPKGSTSEGTFRCGPNGVLRLSITRKHAGQQAGAGATAGGESRP